MRDLNTILDTLAFAWVLSGFVAPIAVAAINDYFLSSVHWQPRPTGRWETHAPTR